MTMQLRLHNIAFINWSLLRNAQPSRLQRSSKETRIQIKPESTQRFSCAMRLASPSLETAKSRARNPTRRVLEQYGTSNVRRRVSIRERTREVAMQR